MGSFRFFLILFSLYLSILQPQIRHEQARGGPIQSSGMRLDMVWWNLFLRAKQQQEQISWNHVQALFPSSVDRVSSNLLDLLSNMYVNAHSEEWCYYLRVWMGIKFQQLISPWSHRCWARRGESCRRRIRWRHRTRSERAFAMISDLTIMIFFPQLLWENLIWKSRINSKIS